VALRIRDTGHGMNDNEIAAAMAPFRTPSPTDEVAAGNGANLSLAKALVEANRGRFHLRSSPNTGTLIEVVFSQAAATA
jgi:signal transduction histidine kinase